MLVCAPPPTDPLAASCCWTAWASSGDVVCAVHPWLLPPPAPTARMLMDTPQTLAAMVIGIWALIGMLALSTWRSSARLLSTFERLTLTSDVAAPPTADAALSPALLTLFAVDEVLHAEVSSSRTSAG